MRLREILMLALVGSAISIPGLAALVAILLVLTPTFSAQQAVNNHRIYSTMEAGRSSAPPPKPPAVQPPVKRLGKLR